MHRITADLALSLHEDTARLAPLDRALRIAAAVTGAGVDTVADWPVDARDRVLIAARAAAFGRFAAVMQACPACDARTEADVDLAALLAAPEADPSIDWHGHRLALTPPSSRAIAGAATTGEDLAAACLAPPVTPANAGAHHPPPETDAPPPASITAALLAARPLLDIRLALECPDCGHGFAPRFDITACLSADIAAAAARLLDQVHTLALAYHWPEAAILALAPGRRAAYLHRLAA